MKKAMINYMQNSKNDELYTPKEAVEMIVKYIPNIKDYDKKGLLDYRLPVIWECTAIKESNIVKILREYGYKVITSHIEDGKSFFDYEPEEEYDIIITNPPYSLKDEFLKRAFELGKPFMFLLPLTALEGKERSKMYNENGGVQLLIPNKRFNFMLDKKGAWFQTSWFCWKCQLEKDLNFINIGDEY